MDYFVKLGRMVEISVYEVIKFKVSYVIGMSFASLNATFKISSGTKTFAKLEILLK